MNGSRLCPAWAAVLALVGSVMLVGLLACSNPPPTPTPTVRPRPKTKESIVVFVDLSAVSEPSLPMTVGRSRRPCGRRTISRAIQDLRIRRRAYD